MLPPAPSRCSEILSESRNCPGVCVLSLLNGAAKAAKAALGAAGTELQAVHRGGALREGEPEAAGWGGAPVSVSPAGNAELRAGQQPKRRPVLTLQLSRTPVLGCLVSFRPLRFSGHYHPARATDAPLS